MKNIASKFWLLEEKKKNLPIPNSGYCCCISQNEHPSERKDLKTLVSKF